MNKEIEKNILEMSNLQKTIMTYEFIIHKIVT